MECKKLIGEILEVIKTELNNDNFIFSRATQRNKEGVIVKRCVFGTLLKHIYTEENHDFVTCDLLESDPYFKKVLETIPYRLFNYLFVGQELDLYDTTKSKTLISKRPVLTEHSTYEEVKSAWQFVYDNYDKVMKAL